MMEKTWARFGVLDFIALIVIFLHASALVGPIGYIAGLPGVFATSILTLSISVIYILMNIRIVLLYANYFLFILFFSFIIVLPISIMIIQFIAEMISRDGVLYWSGVVLMYGLLFLVSAILSWKLTDRALMVFFILCLFLVLFGFIINVVDYSFIREVMVFTGNKMALSLFLSRNLGFFGHPNEAAISVTLYSAFLIFIPISKPRYMRVFVILFGFGLVIITQSRTSMALFSIVVLLFIITYLFQRGVSGAFDVMVFGFALTMSVVLVIIFIQISAQSDVFGGIFERIGSIFDIASSRDGVEDMSAQIRFRMAKEYMMLAGEYPWLGLGFEVLGAQMNSGYLEEVSQISWLQWSLQYGVPYAFFGAFVLLFALYRVASVALKKTCENPFALCFLVIMFIVTLATFSLVDVFFIRSIVIVVGFALGRFIGFEWIVAQSAPVFSSQLKQPRSRMSQIVE